MQVKIIVLFLGIVLIAISTYLLTADKIQSPSFIENTFFKKTPRMGEPGGLQIEQIAESGMSNWQTYRSEEYEFKYPEGLETNYMDTQKWPPIVTVREFDPNFFCENLERVQTPVGLGKQKQVDDKYCLLTVEQGTAGARYVNYTYVAVKNNKHLALEFSLKFVNCGVFIEQMADCEREQEEFDVNSIVDAMLDSFLLTE